MRVLVVDDHEIVRRGVRSLLLSQSNCEVCGEAVDGRDALEKAKQLKPDVILMDVSMPNLNGLEATKLVRDMVPNAEVLILSQHESPEMVRQAFQAGARGYVVKSSISRDLLTALNKVGKHEAFFDATIPTFAKQSSHSDADQILERSAALEQALRTSEELYRTTFELADLGIAHVGVDGHWLRVNDKLCKILGFPREELLKTRFQDFAFADRTDDLVKTQDLTDLSDPYATVKRYRRKDGSVVWVSLRVSAARDAQDQIKHFVAVVEDITERMHMEEQLRQNEDRTRFSLEAANVGTWDWDLVSGEVYWSENMGRVHGQRSGSFHGSFKSFLQGVHTDDRSNVRKTVEQAISGSGRYRAEYRQYRADGDIGWMEGIGRVIFDNSGKAIRMFGVCSDITERKKTEQALRESESQLALALASSKTAIFDWDIIRKRGKWNPEMTAIYGFTPATEEVTAEEWTNLCHPADRDRLAQEAETTYSNNSDFHFEYRVIRPDSSMRWVLSHGRVVREPDGTATRLIGTHTDITTQKHTEEVLQRNEQQFRVLADSIPELCWMAHPDGHLFWYNRRWYEYTGTNAREMEGWGWQSVHDPEILPEVLTNWKKSIETGEPFEMVFPIRAADGSFRPFLTRIRPLKDAKGKVIRWFGINTDIASQRKIEEALREQEARLRAAFSQTYSFLVLLTPSGAIIDANRAAIEAAGCTREELIGRNFWEPWWGQLPEEVAILKNSVAKAAQGELVREECYFSLPDGSRRFAERMLNPILDQDGNTAMIVATGLDMTEQKELRDRLEARVKLRTRELEEKNHALLDQTEVVRQLSGRLLRMQDEERRRIARDLHDSAGQILAALQMNLIPIESQAEKLNAGFGKSIRDSVDLVQQLSNELRTVSYLLHPPLLDEAGLPSALRWYVEGFAERSKIDVELELAPDLGRLSANMEMTIFRIVQECLTNVHRHSGSKKAQIRLSRSLQNVSLEIQDFGKGMQGGANAAIGEKVRPGVGIQGMRERVRQLDGQFDVRSNGNGTIVTARLPLKASSLAVA